MSRTRSVWGVVALACVLSGCLPSDDPPEQAGQPGPPAAQEFERLEDEVEGLPGIDTVALRLYDDAVTGRYIGGDVEVSPGADPVGVLDDVYATLWSFRSWQPFLIDVTATAEGETYGLDGRLNKGGYRLFEDDLEERYGPWPGLGPTP